MDKIVEIVKGLKDLLIFLVPYIVQVLRTMKLEENRKIAEELKKAKSEEEKREAAHKIADAMYRPK